MRSLILGGALVLAAAAPLVAGAFADGAEPPKFEVASIKPSTEERLMGVRAMPGGRLLATAPVKLLIMYAYGMQRSQIAGGPDWINFDRYEIAAKAEGDADRLRLMQMLQGLLQDRFGMRAHRETREAPVYALVTAKNGPKLMASEDGCPAGEAPNATAPCGQIRISPTPAGVRMEGRRVRVSELVRALAVALTEPVLDRTNLSGTFDLKFDFIDGAPGAPAPDSAGSTLWNALQEQLGLKLESAKGPIEFLVIDHIERPTVN